VAKRHVERFEDVDAKQTMFTLQDVTTLQVKIDLPESLVRGLRGNTPDEPPVPVYATFEGQNDRRLPLTLAEVSTRADPQTQTFEVTFNMAPPEGFVVLPGMTATVTADLSSRLIEAGGSHWVPVSAVVADSDLGSRVWVLDPATMTVRGVAVEVGGMQGDQVELRSGLAGGEEIVSIGASYLAEGMRVSRMATGEQAVPRAGDPQ
jgi:RND family efflux transporter MFP subunit